MTEDEVTETQRERDEELAEQIIEPLNPNELDYDTLDSLAICRRMLTQKELLARFGDGLSGDILINTDPDLEPTTKEICLSELLSLIIKIHRSVTNKNHFNSMSFADHTRHYTYIGEDEKNPKKAEMLARFIKLICWENLKEKHNKKYSEYIRAAAENDCIVERIITSIKWTNFKKYLGKVNKTKNKNRNQIIAGFGQLTKDLDKLTLERTVRADVNCIDSFFLPSVMTDGLRIGIPAIDDDLLGGFQPSTLNVFMGKTGGGKSMFCSYLINQCCLQKKRALVCITEGSEKKMIMRVIEGLSGVSSAVSKDCKNGNKVLEDSDRQKIEDAKIIFDKYVFMFKSSEATSVEKIHTDMKAEIERVKNHNAECKFNPTLHPELEYSVNIVDYTGRIAAGSEGDSGWEKIKQAFVERVQFCVNTETVGIDFAQVNSAGEEAALAGKCLTRAHIGLGRAIAQELTNFFTINTKNGSETGYLYVDKQRDGENEGKKFSMQKDFAHGKWDLTDSRELTTNEDSLEDVSKEDKK